MITRNLVRQLEMVEEQIIPTEEPTVLHVEYIDAITKQVVWGFKVHLLVLDRRQDLGAHVPKIVTYDVA